VAPLALEVYDDGGLVTVLLPRAQPVPTSTYRAAQLGRVDVIMIDDGGGAYAGQLDAHSATSRPAFWQGRAHYICAPTLNPAARLVRIEFPAVAWTYREEPEPGGLSRIPDASTPGPRTFTVHRSAVTR
jgi:hypothetical protein